MLKMLVKCAAVAGLASFAVTASAEDLVMGTSSPGGSYFLMGGGLSTEVTKRIKGVTLSTQTTAGSTTNMRLISKDTRGIHLAFANLGAVYNAWTATGKFKGKPKIRVIRAMFTTGISPSHWVTLEKDNIKSFADLAGKKVSLGKAGSGTAAGAEELLDTVGVLGKVKTVNLGFSASSSALRDGNLDAFVIKSEVPAPAVSAISATRKVRLIPLSEAQLTDLMKKNPAYIPFNIEGADYGDGVVNDALSYGTPGTVTARADVSENAVYQIVKLVFSKENLKYMKTVYKGWDPKVSEDAFKSVGVPFHPGAIKAYKELGLM